MFIPVIRYVVVNLRNQFNGSKAIKNKFHLSVYILGVQIYCIQYVVSISVM